MIKYECTVFRILYHNFKPTPPKRGRGIILYLVYKLKNKEKNRSKYASRKSRKMNLKKILDAQGVLSQFYEFLTLKSPSVKQLHPRDMYKIYPNCSNNQSAQLAFHHQKHRVCTDLNTRTRVPSILSLFQRNPK